MFSLTSQIYIQIYIQKCILVQKSWYLDFPATVQEIKGKKGGGGGGGGDREGKTKHIKVGAIHFYLGL